VSYRLLYGPGVERDMSRLPRDVLVAIDATITALSEKPRPVGCAKLKGGGNLWRVRAGVYRVVYSIDDAAKSVTIRIVAHRRDVYRDM
jgi:mRNA interferase RelE/StbE